MQINEVWKNVLAELEIKLSRAYFESYIKSLELDGFVEKDGKFELTVLCPSAFIMTEVKRRFKEDVTTACEKVLGGGVDVTWKIGETRRASSKNEQVSPLFERSNEAMLENTLADIGLKKELNLDTFAVSSSNEMAYAAAKAVSSNPGKAYNPLFLYGGVGVGKTHLMQGVGQKILTDQPELRTIYCTGEEFTNEIIDAIRKKSTSKFKKKYRSVRLLLIDDIQFIAGKNTVQEEFFHTFNAVLKDGGQVIMTSDKPPKEIDALEDRLRSRFEGGLTIDIGQPNFELRSAILMIKARQMNLKMTQEAAHVVADSIEDTRALLGCLMKLSAISMQRGVEIDEQMAAEVAGSVSQAASQAEAKRIKPEDVILTVSSFYGVDPNEVRGSRRLKTLVRPRHIAMFLLNSYFEMSLVEVGSVFGGRDHTTVMHAVRKIEKMVLNQGEVKQEVNQLKKKLMN